MERGETGGFLEACQPASWANAKVNKEALPSNKEAGEDWHQRLSSDLYTLTVACVCTHALVHIHEDLLVFVEDFYICIHKHIDL